MLGYSLEDSSLIATVAGTVPVIDPSGSMLGLVTPQVGDTAGHGPSVTLSWDASSADGYHLYIGTMSQSYQQVADVGLVTT